MFCAARPLDMLTTNMPPQTQVRTDFSNFPSEAVKSSPARVGCPAMEEKTLPFACYGNTGLRDPGEENF